MVTDGNIIKEARFFVKAYSKEFCQTYSDLCGSPFAECIKSALDRPRYGSSEIGYSV